jgi:hypothetical protein
MYLLDIVKRIVEARSSGEDAGDLDILRDRLSRKLVEVEDELKLVEALQLDSGDILPFSEKKMYDKLLKLDRAPEYLREYAWWLQLNGGPDWDDEVDRLLAEADDLES